jgi:hypothetical protein
MRWYQQVQSTLATYRLAWLVRFFEIMFDKITVSRLNSVVYLVQGRCWSREIVCENILNIRQGRTRNDFVNAQCLRTRTWCDCRWIISRCTCSISSSQRTSILSDNLPSIDNGLLTRWREKSSRLILLIRPIRKLKFIDVETMSAREESRSTAAFVQSKTNDCVDMES